MSFWGKKTHNQSNQQQIKTSLEFLDKLTEQLSKLDNSIILSTSFNGNSFESENNNINIVTANNSPIIAATVNSNNALLAIGINKETNTENVYTHIEEVSKCLSELKRLLLDDNGNSFGENGSKKDFSNNTHESSGKNNGDNNKDNNHINNLSNNGVGSNNNGANPSLTGKHNNSNNSNIALSSISGESGKYSSSSSSFSAGSSNAANIQDLFFKNGLLNKLLLKFPILDFESRKNISIIFTNGFGKCIDNKFVYVDYMSSKTETMNLLLTILENTTQSFSNNVEIYLVIGSILEECLNFEQLSRVVLNLNSTTDIIWKLFSNCLLPSFEISTESFQIINLIFLKNPKLISNEFFNNKNNLNKFIKKTNELLKHGNYVTKRQGVKLLSTMILGRAFNQLMTTYISNTDNLKIIMILLNDKSKNLQIETFHLFKVFVANPNKNKPICDILIRNKEKLLKFFEIHFCNLQDMNLKQEKDYIVHILKDLPSSTQKQHTEELLTDVSNSSLKDSQEQTKEEFVNVI
ncbi:hypothetical protein ACO0SA_002775 [Hanseniaspora valbyensis]